MPERHAANYEAVLFDLDGTLVDTAPDFISVLQVQRQRHQLPLLPEQAIRDTVSEGARALTQLAFGGREGEPVFELRKQELLDLYAEEVGLSAVLFETMTETLAQLEAQNIAWGIVTNKPWVYTQRLMARLRLDERCKTCICPDHISKAKPSPEGLLLAAHQLSLNASKCLYVGDHVRDIDAGRAANMATAAARYGYIANKQDVETWRADFIIDSPIELISHLG